MKEAYLHQKLLKKKWPLLTQKPLPNLAILSI